MQESCNLGISNLNYFTLNAPLVGLPPLVSARVRYGSASSLALQPISPGDDLKFATDGFLDGDDGVHLEHERRKH